MENIKFIIEKSSRIEKLIDDLYSKTPEIEPARGVLITESYKMTEDLPVIKRRSAAFAHILKNLPIVIRDNELVVGSSTVVPRSCQIFPEFSYEWLEAELDTISSREADPFYISEQTKKTFRELFPYWKGRTCSDLAKANMIPDAFTAFAEHSVYTPGNYFYNGIGHVSVAYNKVLSKGYRGIIADATAEIEKLDAEIGQLETNLNKKNEKIDIEIFAEEVLGMINQEHVSTEYIDSNKTDGVEKFEDEKPNLASLIQWIFDHLR